MKPQKMILRLSLSLLVLILLADVSSPVLASPSKTAITGYGDLQPAASSGTTWTDGAGNFHFRSLTFSGNVALQGEGMNIRGTQTLVLNGYADPTQSGPFTGTYTISAGVDGKDAILWAGRIEGFSINAISYARIVAQGQGPYLGTQLKLNFIENAATPGNPDPQTFQLEGQILDRQ